MHKTWVLGVGVMLAALTSCEGEPADHDIVWARGSPARLWRMSATEQVPTAVLADTLLPGRSTNLPDWSPDGTKIAFVVGLERGTSVFVANAEGSGLRDLTSDALDNAQWPAWSPDGRQLAFNAGPSAGDQDLFLMNEDGSGVRRLTEGESRDYCPRWSPDGRRIVFTSVVADTFRLMMWDRAEGVTSEVLPWDFEAECADWSPDGSRLAFSSTPDHDYPSLESMADWTPRMSIYILDLTTHSVTQLTDLAGTSTRPRWSNDGRRILFHSTESTGTVLNRRLVSGQAFELYSINVDGSDLKRLTRNEIYDAHPVW
ncbi:MAG: hypothetical protein P8188_13320 [Gemmatimonadota bacterium]